MTNPLRRAVTGLAATLVDPATYGRSPFHDHQSPAGSIPLCETLISWVALAGPYAYKVKKPVRFDFLDYGTLARRQDACLVELELNRRWAPGLYLGLSQLVRTEDGLYFDTDGEVVEYAVRMRRFAREDELDRLVEAGQVSPEDIAKLGSFVADQHERAPRLTTADDPSALDRSARQNFDALRTMLADESLDDLRDWSEQAFSDIEGTLRTRARTGRVRECHGDLHCGNVIRVDGELLPFDGIDFDARLRCIDVASDIAFLVMDLEARGRPDLAASCLDAWLERSGDYAAGPCLRFLLAYRALVRAKVAALRARQSSMDRTGAAMQESHRYVDLARRIAKRPCGSLVLMHGYSGSGKSALAAELVPALPAVRVRADVVRKRLAHVPPMAPSPSPPGEGLYSPAWTSRTYDELAAVTRGLLQSGLNVIVDATFLDRARREPFVALAHALDAPLTVVSCEAAPDVLRARVTTRRGDASDATLAVLERQFELGNALDELPDDAIVTVRTDDPRRRAGVDAMAAAVRRHRTRHRP